MSFYEITGGRPLAGTVAVQGAKNSVLPMMAAALLAPGVSVIHNCPDLTDVSAAMQDKAKELEQKFNIDAQ